MCFDIKEGAKQGDKLSALLFCCVLAWVIKKTEQVVTSGYRIGSKLLAYLAYSDDKGLLGENQSDLQKYLKVFVRNAGEVGLKINLSKTKCLVVSKNNNEALSVVIDGENMEQVSDFKYLGHVITEDNNQEKAVSSRIGLGWAAYKKWKNVFDSPKASIMIKCKIYMIYIQSIVLYGCECITWTERLMNKISVFHNHMLRNILRKRLCDKIPIDELHRKTKLKPIKVIIKERTINWYEFLVARRGIPYQCLQGDVEGTRSRGRPRCRWKNIVRNWITR